MFTVRGELSWNIIYDGVYFYQVVFTPYLLFSQLVFVNFLAISRFLFLF